MFRVFAFCGALALAACSGDTQDPVGPKAPSLIGTAQSVIGGLISRPASTAEQPQTAGLGQLRDSLTRERRAEIGLPVIIAQRQPSGATAALVESARNGSIRTFITPDGLSISLDRGILVATRGIAPDLMIASSVGVLTQIQRGSGESQRVFRWIGTGESLQAETVSCQYARREDIVVEQCRSAAGGGFDNRYWLRNDGTIRASTQLVSPEAGYLYIEMP